MIEPATSEVNLTPSSTELESFADDTVGVAVGAQKLYGPCRDAAVVKDQEKGAAMTLPEDVLRPADRRRVGRAVGRERRVGRQGRGVGRRVVADGLAGTVLPFWSLSTNAMVAGCTASLKVAVTAVFAEHVRGVRRRCLTRH